MFDDASISPYVFEKNYMPDAFGGDSGAKTTGEDMSMSEVTAFLASGQQSYGKSAYMLIYERKSKKPLTEVTPEGKELKLDFKQIPAEVPAWISEVVFGDNKQSLVDRQVCDESFLDFLKDLFNSLCSDMLMTSHTYEYSYSKVHFPVLKSTALDLVGRIVLDMLCYYDKNTNLTSLANSFGTLAIFSDSKHQISEGKMSVVADFLQRVLLDDAGEHFFKIMFTCTDSLSRQKAGKVIACAVIRCVKLLAECAAQEVQR